MISGAAIAVGYRLRREVDPSESIKPRRIEASVLALAIVKNDNLLQKGACFPKTF